MVDFNFWSVFFFALPAYLANAFPIVIGGKTPLDLGLKLWDERRVFGNGKTWRGTLLGILSGWGASIGLNTLLPALNPLQGYTQLALIIAVGAIAGDIIASFLKRRLGMPRGKKVRFLDQLDFLIGAFIFASAYYVPSVLEILFLVLVTPLLHKASNILAFHLSLKKVPW